MKRLVRRIVLISLGGGDGWFVLLEVNSSADVLGAFYRQLHMGIKDTRFGGKHQTLLVRSHEINYIEMLV